MALNLGEVVQAVQEGRVQTLFVDSHVQYWGRVRKESSDVVTYPRQKDLRDDCVVDDLVEEVLRQGKTVEFFDHNLSHKARAVAAILVEET